MIRINLLPPNERRAISMIGGLPWERIFRLSAAGLGAVSVALLVLNGINNGRLSRLNAEWARLQGERTKLSQAQDSLRALQNRTDILKMLKAPQAQWAPRLNLLSDALVTQLWFTSLEYGAPAQSGSSSSPAKPPATAAAQAGSKAGVPAKPAPAALSLKGSAFISDTGSGAPVNRYLQKLKEQEGFHRWFKRAELKSVEQRQLFNDQVSDFEIVMYPEGL